MSIITPFQDAASFIRDAIASVAEQTIDDWELLLVDDQSSDDSPDIARAAARQDKRVRLMRTSRRRGRGAAAARNVGLAEARGEFVAFLDADDIFLPGALESQLALAGTHPSAALICGAARWWYPARERADWIDGLRSLRPGLYQPPYLLEQIILLQRDHVPCTCAVLARREAAIAVGGFEESLSLYEDQTLWARLLARHPAYVGSHVTSLYRQHSASTSAKAERAGHYYRLRAHPARMAFIAWVRDDLSDRASPSTMRALRIARALLDGNASQLSLAERLRYTLLVAGKRWRNITRTPRRLAWRMARRSSSLPSVRQ